MNLPLGYMKVPMMFLEAESPARINIFIFMPVNEKVIPFRKKGDNLSLDDLMT